MNIENINNDGLVSMPDGKTFISKVERYGWTFKDSRGELTSLHKNILKIHPAYQRQSIDKKIMFIASTWSWVACGAIIVGKRNGEFWVIDGQHRVLAAKKRTDIDHLPCLVFETDGIVQEAKGFLDANTGRKPISSLDKFKASIAAGDETAIYIATLFNSLNIVLQRSHATKGLELKSVAWSMKKAQEDRSSFETTVRFAADLCQEYPITETLLDGLYYLQKYCSVTLNDKRFRERLEKIGAIRLNDAARKASAYYSKGGAKVWAEGMLTEINKGLREKNLYYIENKN